MATTPPKGTQISAFNPANYAIDPKLVKTISIEVARKYKVLPLGRVGASLQVAMVDPSNYRALDDLKFITGFNIEPLPGDLSPPSWRRSNMPTTRPKTIAPAPTMT